MAKKSEYLTQTRLEGERMRERALEEFAAESAKNGWLPQQCHAKALDAAVAVALAGNLRTDKSIKNLVGELRLAGHADVRHQFPRLKEPRDEVWSTEAEFLRYTLHGPSQVLVDMMRRQKRTTEQHHLATSRAYLRYLKSAFQPRSR